MKNNQTPFQAAIDQARQTLRDAGFLPETLTTRGGAVIVRGLRLTDGKRVPPPGVLLTFNPRDGREDWDLTLLELATILKKESGS